MHEVRPFRVLAKALIMFSIINLAFALLNPPVDRFSIYNWLIPGRLRFFVGNRRASIIYIGNFEALFNSHVISGTPKAVDEYRVLILGDSQTWGATLTPSQTLTEELNKDGLMACGKHMKFYNLAFPYPSVVKDFLILNRSLRYRPDLIVWMLTTDSFFPSKALDFLTARNPRITIDTLHQYHLDRYDSEVLDRYDSEITYNPNFLESTLIGQSQYLSSLTLLQLCGPVWAATGSDYLVSPYETLDVDMQLNLKFHGYQPPHLPSSAFAFDVLGETHKLIGNLPVLVVNEPIYMPPGKNSDVMYNAINPRWAYDRYRQLLQAFVIQNHWIYLDLYNLIPYQDFTNSELHLNPSGETNLAKSLAPEIVHIECP